MSIWNTLKNKWNTDKAETTISYYRFLDENTEESISEADIQKWIDYGKTLEDIQDDWELVKKLRLCEREYLQLGKRSAKVKKLSETKVKYAEKMNNEITEMKKKYAIMCGDEDEARLESQKAGVAGQALVKAENHYPNILGILGINKPEK